MHLHSLGWILQTIFNCKNTNVSFAKVSPGKKNFSTEQFGEFKKVLEAMVTNAENNRVMQHLRYTTMLQVFYAVHTFFML